MQFNKTFLAVALTLVIGAALVWFGVRDGWFDTKANADIETSQEDSDNLADKVENANTSLNKTFSGKETPISVSGAEAVRGPLVKRISSQGRVHSYQNIEIVSEISGRITSLKVRDGMRLKKGQLIATIDDRQYKSELVSAEARLLEAKANYIAESIGSENLKASSGSVEDKDKALKTLEEQLKKGLISEEDFRSKKLDLELATIRGGTQRDVIVKARTIKAAEVAIEQARLNLEKCEIRAPFSGMVFQTQAALGQLIGGSAVICQLTHMKDLVVKAQVLESEIGKIQENRSAELAFTALPDLPPVIGEVEAISPVVNAEEKTVETIIRFRNVDNRIRPGMFSDLKIDAEIFEDRLMVPKEAVLARNDRKVIFKVGSDNRAKWLYVETGEENDQFIEILGGKLEQGDVVLIDNHFTMGHDTLVKVKLKKTSVQQAAKAN